MERKTVQLIGGILLIVAGIAILFNPTTSVLLLLGIIGALSLVFGVTRLILANRSGQGQRTEDLVVSILAIVIGTVLLLSRFFKIIIVSVISYALGAVLVIRGIIGIVVAIQHKDYMPRWWIPLVVRIAYVVLGVLFFIFPMSSGNALVILLGVSMIAFGADMLIQRFAS